MKNQKGFIIPLLIAVIAMLAIGGGVYIYDNKKTEVPAVVDTTQQSNQTPAVNVQTNNSSSQVDTSNWKTYKYEKYGFEIKLPSDWQAWVSEHERGAYFYLNSLENFKEIEEFKKDIQLRGVGGTDAGPQNNFHIFFRKLFSDSLEEYVKLQSDFIDVQKTTFAGEVAFKGRLLGLYDPLTIFVKNNNHLYEIGLDSVNGMDAQLSDKILSTFKFISSPKVSYTYANHGFSIELPKGFIPKEEQSEGGPALMISLPIGGLAYVTDASFWEKYNIPNYTYVTDKKIGDMTFKVYTYLGSNLYWFKIGNVGYEFSVQKFGTTTDTTGLENLLKTFKFVGWSQN